MAIVPKKVTAARESTSTHFPNETTQAPEDSDQAVKNNQVPETLIDPEDDEGGNTHFSNETEYSDKTNKMHAAATPAKAAAAKAPKHPGIVPLSKESAKKHPAKTTKAAVGDPDMSQGPDADAEFPAGGMDSGTEVEGDADCGAMGEPESGLQDTQHLPNTEDPAAGYLTTGGEEGEAGDDGMSDTGLEGANPQSGLEVPAAEGEGPDEFDDGAGAEGEEEGVAPEGAEIVEDEDLADAGLGGDPSGAEDMSVMDVDGADDDGDDVVFANIGTSVKVIKANRIIASMNKKIATKAGCDGVYLGESFQEVVAVEMSKHGVRAGLKKMGFVMATVNLGRAEVLNKRVEAKAQKLTAAVRRQAQSETAALEQCLAIAAVGINKSYFKDTRNELRAALEAELEAAGVRGAKKLIATVFATKGIDYSKSILTVAQKLAALSEDVRNQHASALDMVGDEGIDEDADMFGDSAAPDFQSEFAGEEGTDDDNEFVDDMEGAEAPETVHAALVRPAQRMRSQSEVSAKATGYSVTAAAVLQGKAPFPFA